MRDPVRPGWGELNIRYPKRPLDLKRLIPVPRRS